MSNRRAQPGRQPVDEEPPEGARFPADVLADNLRAYRLLRRLEQQDVAARLNELGHPWRRVTVSEVERGRRNVSVAELLALVVVLRAPVEQLLDPADHLDGRRAAGISRPPARPPAVRGIRAAGHVRRSARRGAGLALVRP
jgi:transcriptional regulator with XRE-family HTH domain